MSLLDILGNLQANPHSPDPFGTINQGIAAFTAKMEADRQRAIQDAERKRLLARQEAEDKRLAAERDRKLQDDKLKWFVEQGKNARAVGDNERAAAILKQANPLIQSLYGSSGPDVMGAPTGAYDVKTHNPLMNFNNPATAAALDSVFGEQKPTTLAPGYSIVRNGQVEVTAPYAPRIAGSPKTGYSIVDMNSGGAPLPAGVPPAASAPAGRPAMVVPPAAPVARGGGRSGSGGGGRGQRPVAATSAATTTDPDIVPGTQGRNGKGGMRYSHPRTQEAIETAVARARAAALAKQPSRKNHNGEVLYRDPIAARYEADKAEYEARKRWGLKVSKPQPPAPYTHPRPAKVSAAVDAILSRYNIGDEAQA